MKFRQGKKIIAKTLQAMHRYRRNTFWRAMRRVDIDTKCWLIVKYLGDKGA